MKINHFKLAFLLVLLSFSLELFAQVTIVPYEPNGVPNYADSYDDFSVRVRPADGSSDWIELFEYLTWVNDEGINNNNPQGIGPGDVGFYGYSTDYSKSSFVNFDFSGGAIEVEITCNYCISEDKPVHVVDIRPKNLEIPYVINSVLNTVRFQLDQPRNLSIEINKNRNRNMHLFSSKYNIIAPLTNYTSVTDMTERLEKKRGQSSDLSEVWYYPVDNEIIYIDGNEVFRGGIYLDHVDNVQIVGRGVIDNQGMPKNFCNGNGNITPACLNENGDFIGYPEGYDWLRAVRIKNSNNITIKGIVINDMQNNCVNITESNEIHIKGMKAISRVIWGAGIYIEASQNVFVDDCFLRIAEDAIAIYAGRNYQNAVYMNEGGVRNVEVTNTSIYSDRGHPIAFGWHGSIVPGQNVIPDEGKGHIEDVIFDQIDILQHDEYLEAYQGAIAINCGDLNYCQNITFKNIRIEDISNGALLRLKVEPTDAASITLAPGYRINNIVFDGVTFDATSNNTQALITGLEQGRYVNGVHFNNLVIDGQLIEDVSDYPSTSTTYDDDNYDGGFIIGNDVYDVTFNNLPTNDKPFDPVTNIDGVKDGIYQIQNIEAVGSSGSPRYLSKNQQDEIVCATWRTNWVISYTGNDSYRIRHKGSQNYITGQRFVDDVPSQPIEIGNDLDLMLLSGSIPGSEEWELIVVGENNGEKIYRIRNKWWDHNSIQKTDDTEQDGQTDVNTSPWEDLERQQWKLIFQGTEGSKQLQPEVFIYPNPNKNRLHVGFDTDQIGDFKVEIRDLSNNVLIKSHIDAKKDYIDTSRLNVGVYIVSISNDQSVFKKTLIIKD